jgi:hypothetical protein
MKVKREKNSINSWGNSSSWVGKQALNSSLLRVGDDCCLASDQGARSKILASSSLGH